VLLEEADVNPMRICEAGEAGEAGGEENLARTKENTNS
jgi:hypothetical protein